MAKTRVWTRLCLLLLALQFWSSLFFAEGANFHQEAGPVPRSRNPLKRWRTIPFQKPKATKADRRAQLYMEMRYKRTETVSGESLIGLVTYGCIQEKYPASINCTILSKEDAFDSYKVANYYSVNRLSPYPAWTIEFNPKIWKEERLPPQMMLGIEPKDKLVRVFESLSVDNLKFEKDAALRFVNNSLLHDSEIDHFVAYYGINDLIVFSNNYEAFVRPGLEVFVNVARRTVEAANRRASARRQLGYVPEYLLPKKEVKFALFFLMEKMIDPCMVTMTGEDYMAEGVSTEDANYICRIYCLAIRFVAAMSDVSGSDDMEILTCKTLSGEGGCVTRTEMKTTGDKTRVARCWCSATLTTGHGDTAKALMLWCHNLFRRV
ncbi:unnamed protein product [Bemisia tabaci]|uniref:Uncharacterized protein n=1 Tax=Bemisia tabaci TaxID=7038 RepID=A0A9P0AG65_BEMTA|nr:unnamed protein product [Bemisia tabaci]